MTMLSESPFEDVMFGMKVLSADHDMFGGWGVVIKKSGDMFQNEHLHFVTVAWSSGNISVHKHYQYSSNVVVE